MAQGEIDDWAGARRFRFADPARKNAIGLDTVTALYAELQRDPEAVFVLGSTSPDVFSAGADLRASDDDRAQVSDTLYAIYELMVTRPGPVVAVVEGLAVGGGAQLMAAADLRVAGGGARMRWVGAGHGLVVGAWILPELVGRSVATDLALSSRWLDAEQLLAYGLIPQIAPDPWEAASVLVKHLLCLDPRAVADFKTVTSAPGLVEQLSRERTRNAGWDGKATF
ncbi:enoyl-CoA hydratase/isomerase family protein [Epidermidibacterium keratini]|uniref:Enoyl-CoA hydratase/isomerase family protein n=1 Tax=Epidermidibacterium keratini TaxID=1891644 RepID=A0A7L4YKN3_9ACTN|nr:enoyl-CoA hydratase/isomerase family protein [Epidermidibacterium keratini]QHB99699.1 enoyl-CoA hydratase/isomerase family protein [Epidermidibacterium keratini]